MLLNRLTYDVLGAMYALSLVLFFVDAVQPRRKVNRAALLLLFFVFVCETFVLLLRLRQLGHIPVYSRFDTLLLISWLILLIALVLDTFFRVDLLLFFANVFGFAFVLFDAFARHGELSYVTHIGDLLVMHIACAVLSYVGYSFSCVFSMMYLLQDRLLREKRWNRWYLQLPSLERLDTYAFRCVLVAFPLLLVAIVLGIIWGYLTLTHFILLDPKLIATFVLWVMYAVFMILRLRQRWGGRYLAWYNIACFVALVLNFIVIGDFSIFHHST